MSASSDRPSSGADLETRLRTLEQTNRQKDELLATVSHDLRTPLNAIAGWAALLKTGKAGPDEIRRIGETIERNVRAQAKIIADLLDLSRLISGAVPLELQDVEVGRVMESVLRSFTAAARDRKLEIEQRLDADLPAVRADYARIEQVFTNLLDHAVRVAPEGARIRVSVARDGPALQCVVEAAAEGIAAVFLSPYFDRAEGERTGERKPGGAAVTLSIARHLVELHGGRITAAPEAGHSSAAIRVELPIEQRPQVD